MDEKGFDKKTSGGVIKFTPNQQLANELRKPIIKNLKQEKYINHLNIIFGVFIFN